MTDTRGYRPLYTGSDTRCPACHRSNWLVGRSSVECACCNTTLPFAPEEYRARRKR